MLWDIIKEDDKETYINRVINLKIKIIEKNGEDIFFINYKGYNITVPMLVWEFGEELKLASIENVRIEGKSPFDKYFIVNKEYKEKLLEEIYFFLVDNNMDSVLVEKYRVDW